MITFVIFLVPFGPNVNLNLRANGRNIVGQQFSAMLDVAWGDLTASFLRYRFEGLIFEFYGMLII